VFARAARGPRSRFASLQPFQPLLLSWSGRGEAPQLTAAEHAEAPLRLLPERLMAAFYMNELLLKLTIRHDPHPELFDHYESTLALLRSDTSVEAALRRFEKRLLDLIGYGLNLTVEADSGQPVRAEGFYCFRGGAPEAAEPDVPGVLSGRVLLALAEEQPLEGEEALRQARALTRTALDACLEGRELYTRRVARSMSRRSVAT
jgi:DNA repair protein RecO (recombination protein O)